MPQRNVFILNRGPHDYSDAGNFGVLRFCTDGQLDKLDTTAMKELLFQELRDSAPDDLILLSSLTSLCCVATSLMAHLHGEVHLLIHTGSHYVERDLFFYNQG